VVELAADGTQIPSRSGPRLRHWLAAWGVALPLIIVLVLTLVVPIVVLLARSFITVDGIGLSAWQRVLGQPINQRAIVTSLELGLTCATISVLVGTPIAWLVSRMVATHRAAWLGLFNVAAHFGGIGLAFAYIATLGAFGMVTLALGDVGLPLTRRQGDRSRRSSSPTSTPTSRSTF
jgi:putative spermidine/putrescine transport system permease protein